MIPNHPVVHSDPDILGGGHPLAEFLDDFPSVTHAQTVAALRRAAQSLAADAWVA